MRDILFRGKRSDDDEWVDGYYTRFNGIEHRIYTGYAETDCGDYYPDCFTVEPETVGQYTSLTDKNGKKIFEGDIVHCWGGEYACGFWEHNNTFAFTDISNYMQMGELSESEFIEVIGNIHDNPELLKGGEG